MAYRPEFQSRRQIDYQRSLSQPLCIKGDFNPARYCVFHRDRRQVGKHANEREKGIVFALAAP